MIGHNRVDIALNENWSTIYYYLLVGASSVCDQCAERKNMILPLWCWWASMSIFFSDVPRRRNRWLSHTLMPFTQSIWYGLWQLDSFRTHNLSLWSHCCVINSICWCGIFDITAHRIIHYYCLINGWLQPTVGHQQNITTWKYLRSRKQRVILKYPQNWDK